MSAKSAIVSPGTLYLPHRSQTPTWLTSAALLASDIWALSLVYWLAVIIRVLITPGDLSFYLSVYPGIALFVAAFWAQDLYPGLLVHPAEEIRRTCHAVSAVFLFVACTTFVLHTAEWYSRSIFLVMWAASMPLVLLARHVVRAMFAQSRWWGVRAVVIGSGPAAHRIIRALKDQRLGVRIAGVLDFDPPVNWAPDLPPYLGHIVAAQHIATQNIAEYAIVALPAKSYPELRHLIQDYCRGFRHVLLVPDMAGVCSLGVTAREINGEVGFELPQRLFDQRAALTKRVIDLCGSLAALLVLSPFLLLIAAIIKLTSSGPVLYGHSRSGRGGEHFKALKFRTMLQDGDAVLSEYFEANPDQRLIWERDQKLKDDPRVTRFGSWLRRHSLDELPQLWNIVLGHMSLVGPRPIVTDEIPKYGQAYGLYTRVIPGITGLWQVSGRSNTTYDERVALDEYYVRNWSIWLDAYILVRTVKVVLTAEGAY